MTRVTIKKNKKTPTKTCRKNKEIKPQHRAADVWLKDPPEF